MLNILSLLLFVGGVFRWMKEDDDIAVILMGFGYAFAMLAD